MNVMRLEKPKSKLLAGSIIIAVIIVCVVAALLLWPKPTISQRIRRQASFAIFVPDPTLFNVSKKSVSYNNQSKILTYTLSDPANGNSFTVTEQNEPDLLVDGGQQIYQSFTSSLNEYQEIDTALGRVALTKPPHLNGQQTAVASAQQTLIFVKPLQNVSPNQWQSLFNSMGVFK